MITPFAFFQDTSIALDLDAAAFISAANITIDSQISAVNNLVIGLKNNSLWTKLKVIYPIVGGTSSSHKYNLKDPRDLDAAFRVNFVGNWQHDANGAKPLNTNSTPGNYAITYYNPGSQSMSATSSGIGFWSGTSEAPIFSDNTQFGYFSTTSLLIQLQLYSGAEYFTGKCFGGNNFTTNSTRIGFYSTTRIANTQKIYKNGSYLKSETNTNTTVPSITGGLFFGTANNGGSPYNGWSRERFQFLFISEGLTDAENTSLYNVVQSYQNALSRGSLS